MKYNNRPSLENMLGILYRFLSFLACIFQNRRFTDAPSHVMPITLNPCLSSLAIASHTGSTSRSPVRSVQANWAYGKFRFRNRPLTINTSMDFAKTGSEASYCDK